MRYDFFLHLPRRYRTYNTWWRTRWGATSGASLGFPRMDFPTRFLQMFLNCQVQMFVLLELLGLCYIPADAKTQCWMQQINTENTQQVGKWIFRKMAKSALAFYKRCRMDLLKSRTTLCGFQALLRYEDDSCNEFEEKKAWDKVTDKILHLCGGRQNLCTKRQMCWTWCFKDFWERFWKFWIWFWKWKRIFQKCFFGNAIFMKMKKCEFRCKNRRIQPRTTRVC